MVIFKDVVGNSSPDLSITLQRNSTAIDLTNVASVKLIIVRHKDKTVTNAANQTATIQTPATDGIVTYDKRVADFPTAGLYVADALLTYTSGALERLYEQVVFVIREESEG